MEVTQWWHGVLRSMGLIAILLLSITARGQDTVIVQLPRATSDSDYFWNGRPDSKQVELGRLLFFDKILSGNKNISCATCHHPRLHTQDSISLPVGQGGEGLGTNRKLHTSRRTVRERVSRNTPALFNLGAREFTSLFHDGRVERDDTSSSGFRSPAGDRLPPGLVNVLAVQSMFPVASLAEMAGYPYDNPVANAAIAHNLSGEDGVWAQLATRLRDIPTYVETFVAAFDDVNEGIDITMVHAANAIAAFETVAFRSDNSPFDRYLRGDRGAMSQAAQRGMRLFYGRAGCGACHSGVFQTDHKFHSIAMPQIGPGKGDGPSGHEDYGRQRVTGATVDRYRFRTPTLRNAALTGPYGHGGAYADLESMVLHLLNPVEHLYEYSGDAAILPRRSDLEVIDWIVCFDGSVRRALADASEISSTDVNRKDVADIIAFLRDLTDPSILDLSSEIPREVPSGLPVER